ncbi:MAG: pirin family protein, partial [Burkholderiaceae bacterium]|nr:pirin family protein [Burkholderiaceae bacterium]
LLTIPDVAQERGVYSVEGPLEVEGELLEPGQMLVLEPGSTPTLCARETTRVMLVGGAPLGHRHMVWNFVSSRKERILQAQDDWEAQRFPQVPGETEFIPLPARRP